MVLVHLIDVDLVGIDEFLFDNMNNEWTTSEKIIIMSHHIKV